MQTKYNFNLLLIQMAMILFLLNFVTANLLEKLTEMTLTGKCRVMYYDSIVYFIIFRIL